MKVECVITDGSLLPKRYSSLGYGAETAITLKRGQVYEVYATSVWRSIVSVLVVDEDDFPTWYPAEIFKIVCNTVPGDWFFKYYSDNEFGVQAVWGPECLVKDERFYDALNDREPSALHTFRKELSCR
jgi:hypothetical protein